MLIGEQSRGRTAAKSQAVAMTVRAQAVMSIVDRGAGFEFVRAITKRSLAAQHLGLGYRTKRSPKSW
jgi:hypothetical protein